MELTKYSPDCILIEICNNLNNIPENHVNEINFGHSILIPIQKPNKGKGPPKNLRPLNLLHEKNQIKSRKLYIYHTANRLTGLVDQQQI